VSKKGSATERRRFGAHPTRSAATARGALEWLGWQSEWEWWRHPRRRQVLPLPFEAPLIVEKRKEGRSSKSFVGRRKRRKRSFHKK